MREVEGSHYVSYYNTETGVSIYVAYSAYAHASTEPLTDDSTLDQLLTPTLRAIAACDNVNKSYINHVLPEKFLAVQQTGKKATTKLTSVDITTDNFGYCYVYTLEDGSFVVLDGGGGNYNSVDAAYLYNVLVDVHGTTPTSSDPIRIAAWYLSHSHGDHYGMMNYFITNYCNTQKYVYVESVIANTASNDEIYNSYDPNQALANKLDAGSWYRNYDSTYVQYYKVHTGQRFFIGNLEIEVMYTHEDIHPWSMIFFNNTSTVLRLTAHETDGKGNILVGSDTVELMVLGDSQTRVGQILRATYGAFLKTDMW